MTAYHSGMTTREKGKKERGKEQTEERRSEEERAARSDRMCGAERKPRAARYC
jgi:hypothetical protein